jgi:hypothetical protein
MQVREAETVRSRAVVPRWIGLRRQDQRRALDPVWAGCDAGAPEVREAGVTVMYLRFLIGIVAVAARTVLFAAFTTRLSTLFVSDGIVFACLCG